jgi:DNA helicase-2/ATP-dependent DNA helicase PcrA
MTMHTAKGLEFPNVFIVGMEDGVFPHMRSLTEPNELEEERRLAYVGITRARERLFLSHAWSRSLFGATQYNPPSRFLDEIPTGLVDNQGADRRSGRGSARHDHRADGGGRRDGWGSLDRGERGTTNERGDRWRDSDEHRDRVVEAALAAGRHPNPPTPTGADAIGLRTGDDVSHAKFGEGVIIAIRGSGDKAEATVRFRGVGEKTLLLAWSPLTKL